MENKIRTKYADGLDDSDRFIIDAMRQDGRVAFAQIAQQLNVSPGMIRVRYNRLVEMGADQSGCDYQPPPDGLHHHGDDRDQDRWRKNAGGGKKSFGI